MHKGKAEENLAEYMLKRSVNKSTLFSNENYKERWFVLDNDNLKYFDGSLGVSSFRGQKYFNIALVLQDE